MKTRVILTVEVDVEYEPRLDLDGLTPSWVPDNPRFGPIEGVDPASIVDPMALRVHFDTGLFVYKKAKGPLCKGKGVIEDKDNRDYPACYPKFKSMCPECLKEFNRIMDKSN